MADYTEEVRKNIRNKRLKEEIAAELTCHIEEKTQEYLKKGYTPEAAREKADADMGNEPAKVADLLENIHSYSRRGILIRDIVVGIIMLIAVIAEVKFFYLFLFGANELNGTIFCGCCYSLYISLLLYSSKKKYCFFPFILSLFTLSTLPFAIHINFITTFFEAITGGLSDFYSNIVSKEMYTTRIVIIIYLCYMAVVFVSGIAVAAISMAYRKNKFTRKILKTQKIVRIVLSVLLAFTVFSTSLIVPVFFTEPDYKYDYFDGLALIPVDTQAQADEIIARHIRDFRHIEETAQKSYYIFFDYDVFDIRLTAEAYVNGEKCETDSGCYLLNENCDEPVDLFTSAKLFKNELKIESQSTYLLVIPLIGYLLEERPAEDIRAYYSGEDSYLISLPLNEPEYIMLNIQDGRYELKLY